MVKDSLYSLNPRLCVRFTSSRTEVRLDVRRSNSLLPLSYCRLSRNGRANTFRVWAAFLTSGLSASYSIIVSRYRMLNPLNTDFENSINALTASLSFLCNHIEHSLKPFEKVVLLTFKPPYLCGGSTFKTAVFHMKLLGDRYGI